MTGNPNEDHINTSYVEQYNLTMRMSMRRFTRLTNAFYMVFYIFCRSHKTLSKPYPTTPAMAAGLSQQVHDMDWLLDLVEAYTPKLGPRSPLQAEGQNCLKGRCLWTRYKNEMLKSLSSPNL